MTLTACRAYRECKQAWVCDDPQRIEIPKSNNDSILTMGPDREAEEGIGLVLVAAQLEPKAILESSRLPTSCIIKTIMYYQLRPCNTNTIGVGCSLAMVLCVTPIFQVGRIAVPSSVEADILSSVPCPRMNLLINMTTLHCHLLPFSLALSIMERRREAQSFGL